MAAYDLEEFDNDYEIPYKGDMNERYMILFKLLYLHFINTLNLDKFFQNLDIKGKYYHETDYYEKTYEMLRKFSEEFEVFASKYIR